MYQSVMAQRQGTGSSGVGFAFMVVDVKELHPDKDLCLVSDVQTGQFQQVGISRRDSIAWPQVGDRWLVDRSQGTWTLRCKITGTAAPVITGSRATVSAPLQALVGALEGLGLVDDQTTASTVAAEVWQTVALVNGFTGYTSGTDDVTVRYRLNRDQTVTVEGRATPPATVANGVTMFTIASGYRPPVPKYQTTIVANGVAGTIAYGKDGTVGLYDFGGTTPTRVLFHARYSLV